MLHEIPDQRRAQGKRHDLPTLLTLAILALCCGHTSYQSMQEWCENYQEKMIQQVPFLAGHMPHSATFHRVFASLDVKVFEEVVGKWLQAIIPLEKGEGIALDGKEIHGTGVCLVAAFAHVAKSVLFEEGTDMKGKELIIGPDVLKHITIKDHVITGDALFAQRSLCDQITKEHGGYVFRVKGNQETMEQDIRLFFNDLPFGAKVQSYTTVDRWKGQIEKREVKVSSEITDYLSWPGLTHVWWMKKMVTKDGKTSTTESVGIASLPEKIIGNKVVVEEVVSYIRGHWGIETRLHRTRDVVFGEDKATIRKGHAPQTMAVLRNIVISIFHRGTVRNFKSAMRHFAAKPDKLFAFLGLTAVAQTVTIA